MNKVLIVLLSLLYVAFAQRATVTLLQPRMYDASSNIESQCNVKNMASNPVVLDNCPGGSTCVEDENSNGKGRCTVFTLAEHQGATAFDYTASRILRAETQLDSSGAAISCSHATIDATTPDNEQKWRCIEHGVHLFVGDSESVDDYESSCTVSFAGNIGTQMTKGTLGAGHDVAGQTMTVTNDVGFLKVSSTKRLSCYYIPQNNKYLGYGYAQVQFTKKAASLGLGEKAAKIVKVPLRYVPGNREVAGDVTSSASPVDPDLSNAHALLSIPSANDGIVDSTSIKGTLKIDYKLNVMDSRYLINSQSGVEVLSQSTGSFNLIKEGLEIHNDYSTFYDASLNSFVNTGINAKPLAYSDYKTGNCSKVGQSAGASLAVTGCDLEGGFYGRKYAQYELQGTYEATYGGLQHWKKGYVGCQLCKNRLAVQGFSTQGGSPQIDVALDIDVTSLKSGCVGNSTNSCISLDNIFADAVGNGVEHGKALRLPNCDGDGSDCGSVGGYDPQHVNGHVLGEFFTPKLQGTTDYEDYDDDFDFLSSTRLIVTDDTKFVNGSSNSGLEVHTECASAGSGKVYTMSADMLAAAQDLFYNKCRIKVLNKQFAKVSNIIFFKDTNSKSDCSGSSCVGAVYAQITQVDGRRILVGDAELSLLRRKLATVEKAGSAITMSISKYTDTETQILHFDILGTNTMMGYNSLNQKCTGSKQPTNDCLEAAVPSELTFSTSSVNGEAKEHTIRSSPSCTGFLDVQFKDLNNTFAVYDLRIPCSRTTAKASDNIELTFEFDLSYDLVTNKVTAKGHYLPAMDSYERFNHSVSSALNEDLKVEVSYGYCDASNDIVRNNESGAFVDCDQSDNANGKFSDVAGSDYFESTGLNLDKWSHCAQKVEDDNTNDAYIITTKIAMRYERKLKYASSSSSIMSTNYFCADRKFITTIKRDASATVTVATLRAPTLERAVTVEDIQWVACAGTNSFKLKISVASVQKDTTDDNTAWANSNLKQVLKPTGSTAEDTDNLMIDVGLMTAGNTLHQFDLVSSCITVSASDCAERCTDAGVCTAQASADDSSGSAFSRLTHTETDLVLRGEFTNSDVDSDVNIITKYVECPLDEQNEASGYVRAAATMQCDEAISNASSPTVDGATDCSQAFTTDLGTADVKLYITNNSSEAHLLTDAEASAAITANWRIRQASIYIERYEKNFDGTVGSELSSEKFCECGSKTTPYNSATLCTEQADRVFGLIPFTTLECGKTVGGATTYDSIRFNFLPLADATNDLFRVKFVLLAENTDLDNASSRRRLRSITHYQVLNSRKQLSSTSAVSSDAGAFAVQQPSYNTVDDVATDAPADPASSEEPVTAAPSSGVTDDVDHKHDTEVDTVAIIAISISVVLVVALLLMWVYGCFTKTPSDAKAAVGQMLSNNEEGNGFRTQRFSNLRY